MRQKTASQDGPHVGLFATCLVDLMRPAVGYANGDLLSRVGCRVSAPGPKGIPWDRRLILTVNDGPVSKTDTGADRRNRHSSVSVRLRQSDNDEFVAADTYRRILNKGPTW